VGGWHEWVDRYGSLFTSLFIMFLATFTPCILSFFMFSIISQFSFLSEAGSRVRAGGHGAEFRCHFPCCMGSCRYNRGRGELLYY
jgi:hypothetical protein